jgi:polyhydroxybutyrate depolymerase
MRYGPRVSSTRSVAAFLSFGLAVLASCGGETDAPTPAGAPASSGAPGTTEPSAPPAATGNPDAPPAPQPPAPACQGKEKLTGDIDWTIHQRTVHVHVPASYDPAKRIPVVLDFHGFSSNGSEQATYAGMNTKAESAGFIAVHPEGTGIPQGWNAGICCGAPSALGTKDVELVAAIIDELANKVCLDDKRVFATGLSNGGFLSHRLACELSSRIAAIAPVAGVLGIATCNPPRPVPVMQFHGTGDTLVPYYGNIATGFPSVASTIEDWAERNGCTDEPKSSFDKDDTHCVTQSQCNAGAEVTLCTIDAGGHTWPGSSLNLPTFGKTTQAIKATDAMWDFFQKHPMP